jgi:hypothetical protein
MRCTVVAVFSEDLDHSVFGVARSPTRTQLTRSRTGGTTALLNGGSLLRLHDGLTVTGTIVWPGIER